MSEATLPEPWRSLATEWVPRLLACWSVDGLEVGGGNLRLLGMPDVPKVVDGTLIISVGPVCYRTSNRDVIAYCRGDAVRVGEQAVSFPRPWPRIEGIPDGLRITWPEPGVVHGLLARAVGVAIREVRLYARSAVVILDNYPDKTLRW